MTITYRPAIADDHSFILSAWSSSLKGTRDVPFIHDDDWADVMRPVLTRALATAPTVIVADSGALLGFIAASPSYVWYCYVKQAYRRAGVARALLGAAGIDPASRFGYACRTRSSWEILQTAGKCPASRYDPFTARYAQREATP